MKAGAQSSFFQWKKTQVTGQLMIQFFAMIAAWAGERISPASSLPRPFGIPRCDAAIYGDLKLTPWWDPLRGEPCFEKIVASLNPKREFTTDDMITRIGRTLPAWRRRRSKSGCTESLVS